MYYGRIIFLDQDNTCMSIMAEAIMKRILRRGGPEILSRGLVVLFPEPVNPKAVAVLKGDGLRPAKNGSEELTAADAAENTLVFAMSESVRRRAEEVLSGSGATICSLGEYAGQEGDMTEPYGGTLAQYGACYEYLDFVVKVACEKLLFSEE